MRPRVEMDRITKTKGRTMANPSTSRGQVYFFRHDENMRRTLPIQAMMAKYGWSGYGRYWALVEIMRSAPGYKLPIKNDHFYGFIKSELRCSKDKARQFVEDCIGEFRLFQTDGTAMWCESLMENMEYMEKRSEIGRKAANAKHDKEVEIAQNRGRGVTSDVRVHSVCDVKQCQ